MAQGRPVFGHNDQQLPPGPASPGPGPSRNECRVLRRLRCRPQRRPGGGVPGRRVRLPADPGHGGGRLRRVDGGRVPGRRGRDHRREPAELGPRLRAPGPPGGGAGTGVPGRRPPGQCPGPPAAGVDLLPDRRVLRRRRRRRLASDGGAQPGLLCRRRRAPGSAGGADRGPLRGRVASRLPGAPGGRRPGGGRSPAADPGGGGRVRLQCRGALLPPGCPREPNGDGTCSSSTVPVNPAACG